MCSSDLVSLFGGRRVVTVVHCDELDFASGKGGPVLICGLGNGESLSALRALSPKRELHGVWAYTDSDFERYLSEMLVL